MAVIIRPDIALAIHQLARFLINLKLLYYKVVHKVIGYLTGIKDLVLYFSNANNLEIISNAFFTDNTLD